jgi:hypothetical protein
VGVHLGTAPESNLTKIPYSPERHKEAAPFGLIAIVGSASYAATITVDSSNPDGWAFSNTDNNNDDASGGYVIGPATPPLGNGSANFVVSDPTKESSEILRNVSIVPNLASGFNASYYTYVATTSVGTTEGSAPTLQFDLANGMYQGRLVFDPGELSGAVVLGTWQSWSNIISDDAWWFSRPLDGSSCTVINPCTFATAEAVLAGDDITAEDVLFKAGAEQASYNGNVDDFTLTFSGSSNTYNFDVPEPATLSLFAVALIGLWGFEWRRRRTL